MLLKAKENAFICKKQKSTPKKRIFRVPYAVNSTPYVVNLKFLCRNLDSLGSQFRALARSIRLLVQSIIVLVRLNRLPKAIKERLALHLFIVG